MACSPSTTPVVSMPPQVPLNAVQRWKMHFTAALQKQPCQCTTPMAEQRMMISCKLWTGSGKQQKDLKSHSKQSVQLPNWCMLLDVFDLQKCFYSFIMYWILRNNSSNPPIIPSPTDPFNDRCRESHIISHSSTIVATYAVGADGVKKCPLCCFSGVEMELIHSLGSAPPYPTAPQMG